jgi:hypothetical protein
MEIPSDPTPVAGDAIVAIVATQHRGEMSMLLADRLVPITLAPGAIPGDLPRRNHTQPSAAPAKTRNAITHLRTGP